MTTSLEKILKHFINGKEYSPGLIVNIVSVETDKNDNIRAVFDIDKEKFNSNYIRTDKQVCENFKNVD